MRKLMHSYRTRLLVSFLICALLPMLISSMVLVHIMDTWLNRKNQEFIVRQMESVLTAADTIRTGLEEAADLLEPEKNIQKVLHGHYIPDTTINTALYRATEPLRGFGTASLYDLRGNPLYSTGNKARCPRLSPDWGILHSAAQAEGAPVFMAPTQYREGNPFLLQGAVQLHGSRPGSGGYLVLHMDQGDFEKLFGSRHDLRYGLLIVNRFWRPVYASSPELATQDAPMLRSQLLRGQPLGQKDQLYEIALHEPTGLYMVLQKPQVFSRDTARMMYLISLSCGLFCIAFAVLIYLPMSKQITAPIQGLHRAFRKLEEDDLEVRLPDDRPDELGDLYRAFNHTVKALDQNRADLIQGQKDLNESQIRLLQTQLNPHFLCNTLDTMKWISKIHKVPEVAEMSASLADILRYCITAEKFVPLYRETDFLERYISIQKIRMGEKFDFQVDLPVELAGCIVPKMILQPLVENAVIHGLQDSQESRITVTVRTVGTMLKITVSDNGCGLPEDLVGKPYTRPPHSEGHHLGLYNVTTILSRNYGPGCGLFLDRGPGGVGTSVIATLPIETEESTHD